MKKLVFIFILSPLLSLSQSGFVEYTDSLGIGSGQGSNGVAVCDFDKDGDLDFYISATASPNQFYENQGDSVFVDIAPLTGLDSYAFSKAAVWADFDNDGWDDLYVGNYSADHLVFKNMGDGTFVDFTDSTTIATQTNPNSLNVVDINNDGFLDIYLSNINQPNELFINQGDFTFTEESEEYGLIDSYTVAMGTIFFDYDFDGDLDCYLTHDADQAAIFYENNGDGTFTDKSVESGLNVERNGMGVDVGDYDLDGDLDIYLSNLYPNDLLRNEGDGTFTNVTQGSGTGDPAMGWGMFFFDYDNDVDKDIFINNMSSMGNFPNKLYRNEGNGQFSSAIMQGETLESYSAGYGAAYADFNRDGCLDIILANVSFNDVNQVFINENTGNNWVVFKLEGTISNRNAINSQVFVYSDSLMQVDELLGASGYCSQNMAGEHFGLGQRTLVDSVRIEWPSGLVETYDSIPANDTYFITEGEGIMTFNEMYPPPVVEGPDTIFSPPPFELVLNNPGSAFGEVPLDFFDPSLQLDEVENEDVAASVSEFESSQIQSFPNPSSQKVSWNLPFNSEFTLSIYDMSGKIVFTKNYEPMSLLSLDLSSINSSDSQFIYEFKTADELISGRFMVIR